MSTLQTVIDQLTPIVRDVTGINFVPDDPTEEIPTFPACIIYADSGRVLYGAFPDIRYYHNIVIAVLTELDSIGLPLAHRMMAPKLEPIAEAIYDGIDDGTITALENLPEMDYTFQPVQWGALTLFGFFLTLQDVKIRRDRSQFGSLLVDLVSYYKMEESSGARVDSVSGFDLNEVNTVASTTGIVGNGALLIAANNEYLGHGVNSTFDFAESYSLSAWVKANSWPTNAAIVNHWNSTSTQRRYTLQMEEDRINFIHVDSGGTEQLLQKLITNDTAVWYHVVAVYDHRDQEMRLYRNGVVVNSMPMTTGTTLNTGAAFRVGALFSSTFNTDGVIDEVGVWSRALASTEVNSLYNNGAGVTYPFIGT